MLSSWYFVSDQINSICSLIFGYRSPCPNASVLLSESGVRRQQDGACPGERLMGLILIFLFQVYKQAMKAKLWWLQDLTSPNHYQTSLHHYM